MNHLFFTLLFCCVCLSIGTVFGLRFYGPLLVQVSDKKIKFLILSWVVLLVVLNVAHYYLSWYMQDHRPTLSSQFMPQIFLVTAMVTSVFGRYRAIQISERGK